MIPSKTILVAAAALFAAAIFGGAGEASAGGGLRGSPFCHWYKQQAMNTGSEYWWARWRRCIRGDYWD